MTSLRDYLRAERPDTTEPASFYIPGATHWFARQERPIEEVPLDVVDEEVKVDLAKELDTLGD